MSKTQLKKLKIEKFRALNNVEVELGEHITVICGKNGTSKSSILGIAAQIFSFEKDYIKGEPINYQQIAGGAFKSQYREHFRISDKFDLPGSMKVEIELHDGYTNQAATAKLELMKRAKSPRPVVRNNSTASGNKSRNFTHPVVFLSLKRLYPITDRKYDVIDFEYLTAHRQDFIGLTNELLNRNSALATGTSGTISSAVAHGENYDQESVSAGEDNAGQIVLAIMSFRKLKEEYSDYKGGLLLIDEADAGMFPTAQTNLFKILDRECKNLNLQVIMTSHSPTLIEFAFEKSLKFRRLFKTIYLSNTYGDVQVMQNMSWPQISADINAKTIVASKDASLPKVNIYFEDKEAFDFFRVIMRRQSLNKFINPLPDISLGCSNYIQLINKKVIEFSEKSILCLDADVAKNLKGKNPKTIILLPGQLPPDQLIFEYLYNLPAKHDFWKNDLQFTRDVFTNSASELIRELAISGNEIDVAALVSAYQTRDTGNKQKPRDMFKRFYKDVEFQKLVMGSIKSHNPWKSWVDHNPTVCNQFLSTFLVTIRNVLKNGHYIDEAKLALLSVRLRGK